VHLPEVTTVAVEEQTGATEAPGLYCDYGRHHGIILRDINWTVTQK